MNDDRAAFKELADKYAGGEGPEITARGLPEKMYELAKELADTVVKANRLKKELTELNKRINAISYGELAALMLEKDVVNISISNGVSLTLQPYYKAGLPKKMKPEKREAGLAYLREHAPQLISTVVSLSYDAEEKEIAEKVIATLREVGLEPEVDEAVHWATLTSWVKERFLRGEELPLETLNAKIGSFVDMNVDEEAARAFGLLKKNIKQFTNPYGGDDEDEG